MSEHRNLKLYSTLPHPCSYLEGEDATTVFIDPEAEVDQDLYSQLSAIGFRRSGGHLYRPRCERCQQCVPTRVPVTSFSPSRNQRRVLRRNSDLRAVELDNMASDECYELYARYIEQRHRDGDMYPPSREQFHSFLSREWGVTRFTGFYLGAQLMGVAVYDLLADGLSAIYTFFEPDAHQRGLGTFGVLWEIEEAKRLGLQYVYLGYWIRDCQKMRYKTQYRPIELFVNNQWVVLK